MDGINFGLLGDNAFEAYQKFQSADTQKQLNQQQLAQSQQATRLGAARERAMAAEAAQQKTLAAITQIAGFNTRAAALADLDARRAAGELDEPTYTRISSKLPADDSGMSKWQLDTLRGLLPAADQYAAMKDEQAQSQLDQQFGMGALAAPAPAPAPAPAVTNNLAPAENVNALADKTLPPVTVTAARAPSMPSEEQAARMAGSSHKPTAEAGQRILAFYASQPELSKLQAQKNRLIAMGATNNDPEIREINAHINKINTHAPLSYAPVLTSIVDPSNPKQMLTVNARSYQGGGVGAKGVLGLAGKEPKSAVDEEKQVKGREDVDLLIAQLRNNYNNLQAAGDITSVKNRGGTNLAAGLGSSPAGQAVGRVFGTASQSERNSIAQTRPLLLAAIKNATGMSAKQMDSNVELQMYLRSATDPSLDYEANMRALANLEKMMGTIKPAAQNNDILLQADKILRGGK